MNVSADMRYNPCSLEPASYSVKVIEKVSHEMFQDILDAPFKEWPCISLHAKEIAHDIKSKRDCILVIYCDESSDAILVHGAGHNYACMAAYAPGFMVAVEQNVRDEVLAAVMNHAIQALESEKTNSVIQLMLTWDELRQRLGFEVTVENGMCGIAMDEIFNMPIVKAHYYEDEGIHINTESTILRQYIAPRQMDDIHL